MPQSLRALVKDRSLTREEWIRSAENRLWDIKPYLDVFTLQEIGDLKILVSLDKAHAIKDDAPRVVGGDVRGLKFQGIFDTQVTKRVREDEDCTILKFWGVSRSGEWVVVRVILTLGDKIDSIYKNRVEKAEVVEIRKVTLAVLLREMSAHPMGIWDSLGLAIRHWAFERKRIYEIAQSMADEVVLGERLWHMLPKATES